MSVTSANPELLGDFVEDSSMRVSRLLSTLSSVRTTCSTVTAACDFQHPSTPALGALSEVLSTFETNAQFVETIRADLVAADTCNADGIATVSDATLGASLRAAGLDQAPSLVDVPEIELYGQPPYSGFVDDPIGLANGNFLLRDGDLPIHGVASVLSVIRTYNSRDRRAGWFGPGWASVLDTALAIADDLVTFRAPDGSGSEFRADGDGGWVASGRRGQTLERTPTGWTVRQGRNRSWSFAEDGTLQSLTAVAARVVVERTDEEVTLVEQTSGRSVTYRLDRALGRATGARAGDGREVSYRYDEHDRLVHVVRDRGAVTFRHDAAGFVAEVIDADGIVVCRNTYDAEGRVLTQVEAHGRETAYEYGRDGVAVVTAADGAPPNVMVHDRRGRMTAMIDGLGNTMRLAYDDRDQVIQAVDRTGAVTRFAHDDRGNLVRRTDPDGLTFELDWDDQDRVVQQRARSGAVTRFAYQGEQRDPSHIVQPDGGEVRIAYGATGLPEVLTDADGVTTTLHWNVDGLLARLVDGGGGELTFGYDAAGRTTAIRSAVGTEASAVLDAAGRVLELHTATGVRTASWSAAGRALGGSDQAGARWEAELDAAGELVSVRDGEGTVATYERDGLGRVTSVADALGAVRRLEYDPVGRQVASTDALGGRTEVDHDPEGRVLAITDASGRTASRELDVLGRPTMLVAPGGGTSLLSYHPDGQVASATDTAGNEWLYEVDAMGRVVASTDPLGNTTSISWTPGGRLDTVRSPLGREYRHRYDAAGRLALVIEPDGTEVHLERRADGSLLRATRNGREHAWEHDDLGHLRAVTGPLGAVTIGQEAGRVTSLGWGPEGQVHFDWDQRGLLAAATDPAGIRTEFTHDRVGRLVAQRTGGAEDVFTWDGAGRLTSMTDVHGERTELSWDPRGVVEQVVRADGSGLRWLYGPDGQATGARALDGSELLTLVRDARGEVAEATGPDGALRVAADPVGRPVHVATSAGALRYRWDADGDLVQLADDRGFALDVVRDAHGAATGFAVGGRQVALPEQPDLLVDDLGRVTRDERGNRFAYDHVGRLVQTEGKTGTVRYGWDDRGHLATEHRPEGTCTSTWGPAGELLRRVDADGRVTDYEHDRLGRRTAARRDDGARTLYRWNALGQLGRVEHHGADGSLVAHDLRWDPAGRPWEIDGTPLLWDRVGGDRLLGLGDRRFVWARGQVLEITDPDARWDRRVGDDPWGDDGGSGLRLGYRGELALDGLLLLGARVYDTETRCFLSRDPERSQPGAPHFAALYAYAWGDPVNRVDPSGLKPLSDAEYEAFREQASKGFFEKHWKTIVKGAIIVTGAVVMVAATATLGPVGLIVTGAIVGAVVNGANTAIDGGSLQDIGRDALVGGVFGALTAGISTRLPPIAPGLTRGQQFVAGAWRNAVGEVPAAYGAEAASSYLPIGNPDRDYNFGMATFQAATGTLAGPVLNAARGGRATNPNPQPDATPPSGPRLDPPTGGPALDGGSAGGTGGRGPGDLYTNPTAEGLQEVEGIGPVLSERILEAQRNGALNSKEDLLDIKGIGPAKQDALAQHFGLD